MNNKLKINFKSNIKAMMKFCFLILSLLFIQCSNEGQIQPNDNNSPQAKPNDNNSPQPQPNPTYNADFTIETLDISNINPYSCSSGCRIVTSVQYFSYADKGICWSTSNNPTINDNFISENSNKDDFFTEYINSNKLLRISNLKPNTLYYVRGYVKTGKNAELITYDSNIKTFTTASINNLYVGKNYCGGYISYLLQPNDYGYEPNKPHGIIAGPYNSLTHKWGNYCECAGGFSLNSNGKYGAGINNTVTALNNIKIKCCGYPAVLYCYNYSVNNFNDWYLPAKSELDNIKTNLYANNIGSYSSGNYWSSTERSVFLAHLTSFNYGSAGGDKNEQHRVIPVRIF